MVERKKSTKRAPARKTTAKKPATRRKRAPAVQQSATKTAKKPGRKSFKPTEAQRYSVGLMASIGIPQDFIASALEIDPKTLRQHFRLELDTGATKMITRVADSLVRQAIAGSVPACIFILKCRAGWSEHAGRPEAAQKLGKKEIRLGDAQTPPEDSKWAGLLN